MAEIISFPYDSQATQQDLRGLPIYDRAIDSKTFRLLFKKWFTTGVFPNPSDSFKVVENATHGVLVKKGYAMIDGVMTNMEKDFPVRLDNATTNRLDRIVLRVDTNISVRKTDIFVLKGNGMTPKPITRDSTIYDILLAEVLVKPNSSTIINANIEDTRSRSDVCGIVASTIKEIDTTFVYEQIKSDMKSFKENEQKQFVEFSKAQEEEFKSWFNSLKIMLDGNVATKLQQQITENTNMLKKAIFFKG